MPYIIIAQNSVGFGIYDEPQDQMKGLGLLRKTNRISNKLKRTFAQITDLPEDLIMGLSKMVLLGKKEFYIENYNGIKEYEDNRINVKTINGDVIIDGDRLSIEEINDSEIVVRGVIKKILLEGEE